MQGGMQTGAVLHRADTYTSAQRSVTYTEHLRDHLGTLLVELHQQKARRAIAAVHVSCELHAGTPQCAG